jgi:thymidylate kinase
MPSATKIIAIEGIDGAGKSTFCSLLHERIGPSTAALAKTPYGELNHLTDMARKQGRMAAFCAYLLSNIATIQQFVDSEWLILDRYLLSTIVYHQDIFDALSPSLRKVLLSTLKTPAISVLLTVDPDVAAGRLEARNEQAANHTELSGDLAARFATYIRHSDVEAMLGKLLILKSNTIAEQDQALHAVLRAME